MIKRAFAVATLLAVACTGLAFAQDKIENAISDPGGDLIFCPLDGYKSGIQTLSPPVLVPDNNVAGVRLGPIIIPPDGSSIVDVIIDFRMAHSWVGDLVASVSYDHDCLPTTPDIGPVRILARQNRGNCAGQGSPFGCSADLLCANTLEFSDAATARVGEPICSTPVAGGCYLPGSVSCAELLSTFDGQLKGGCWYLNVSDMAGGDTGSVCEWSVHIMNSTTGTENTSWGSVKGLYQ
jgi:hypothetical protein